MSTHTDALSSAQAHSAHRPVISIQVHGDELLARARAIRLCLRRGIDMAVKIVRMWYL